MIMVTKLFEADICNLLGGIRIILCNKNYTIFELVKHNMHHDVRIQLAMICE